MNDIIMGKLAKHLLESDRNEIREIVGGIQKRIDSSKRRFPSPNQAESPPKNPPPEANDQLANRCSSLAIHAS